MWISEQRLRVHRWLGGPLAAAVLGTATLPVAAQNATWLTTATVAGSPAGTFDVAAGANWNTGTTPGIADTAFFGASTTTALSIAANSSFGGWTFNSGASAYTLVNNASLQFWTTGIVSNGGGLSIVNQNAIVWFNSSTAGGASITNDNLLQFVGNSSAGMSVVTNNNFVLFQDSSTPAGAQLVNNGTLDISTSSGPAGDNKLTAGSIGGTGQFFLGANELTVGSNNLDSTSSGDISDCGATGTDCFAAGATGGSLVKVGTGTMTLAGVNTYSGGTTFAGGAVSVSDDSGLGDPAGALTFNGGTLQVTGTNFSSTTRTINWGVNGGGFDIADAGNAFTVTQMLSGTGGLSKLGPGTLVLSGSNSYSGATSVLAGTLQAGGLFSFSSASTHNVAAGASIDLAGTLQNIGSLSGAGTVTNSAVGGAARLITGTDNTSATFSGSIQNGAGTTEVWIDGTGITTFTGTNTYTGGTAICSCSTLQLGDGGTGGSIAGDVTNGGTLIFNRSNSHTFGGVISDDNTDLGKVVQLGTGVTILSGANTYSGGTTIAGGTLSVASDANLGNLVGGLTFNGGLLQVTGTGFTSTARTIAWDAGGGGFDIADAANTFTLAQILTGSGGLTKAGAGTLLLTAINSYTGATTITGGTLRQGVAGALGSSGAVTIASGATLDLGSFNTSIGSLAGAGNLTLGGTLTAGGDNTSTTFSGGISGTGGLTKTGTGRLNLTGTSSYGGATSLDGGTLSVNGSIANSAVTVNAGGTLGGNGTVGSTTLKGGTLSPGNSVGLLTVAGNLVFTAASSYLVEVTTAGADRVNATGTATLSGATVNASFAAGNYIDKQYTIVDAAGGIIGTFGTLANTNLPTNFKSSLGYDATHAYLNLVLDFTPTPTPGPTPAPVNNGLNINRTQVANALTGYFNRTGSIPLAFGALSPDGLTLVSGETATATQQATFDVMNQFMGLLTDPTVAGRDATLPFSAVFSFSDQTLAHAGVGRDALAMITKAVPRTPTFEARWSVWASAFGGSRNTDGNAVTGSNNARASAGGVAVGADYLLSPNTIAGFALSGGATSFSLANAGAGRSDLFQAGAHVRHSVGSAYLVAAAAYGWQEVTTDRSVGIDRLHANYTSNAFSARIEGGNRYLLPWMNGIGVTPYAAVQVTTLDLPGHAETVSGSASTFALNYNSKMVIAPRSELGLRSDKSFAVNDAIFTLRGRAAWAHDYSTDRSIAAVFRTLPGATFTVNGAAPSGDSALTTASAEMKFVNGVSVAATFDGEFSSVTRSYAGKGVVRYVW